MITVARRAGLSPSHPGGRYAIQLPGDVRRVQVSVADLQVGVLGQRDAVRVLAEPAPNKPQLALGVHRRAHVLHDGRVVHVRLY